MLIQTEPSPLSQASSPTSSPHRPKQRLRSLLWALALRRCWGFRWTSKERSGSRTGEVVVREDWQFFLMSKAGHLCSFWTCFNDKQNPSQRQTKAQFHFTTRCNEAKKTFKQMFEQSWTICCAWKLSFRLVCLSQTIWKVKTMLANAPKQVSRLFSMFSRLCSKEPPPKPIAFWDFQRPQVLRPPGTPTWR